MRTKAEAAAKQRESGPLQALVDIVPSNIFAAATNNRNMLQIIFFALFFGIGMILLPEVSAQPVKAFFDSFNAIILKLIDMIMMVAPYGVFALLAALVVEAPSLELFQALALYAVTLLLGLATMILVYAVIVKAFTGRNPSFFFKGIAPAQLLAFSTSSSAATLPVTMECRRNLGVDKEVTSFVLPIGATINMDGTSVYQGVAAVFIGRLWLRFEPISSIGDYLYCHLSVYWNCCGSQCRDSDVGYRSGTSGDSRGRIGLDFCH